MARGDIPPQTLPLFASAALLPIDPKPVKTRPIAIGQALHRLVTKTLLPAAISESKDYLAPQKMANGQAAGLDAILHDARMAMTRHGNDDQFVTVSIDARNVFNARKRQAILDCLPTRAPSLARFINAAYGKTQAPLYIPGQSVRATQRSAEGTQLGDPAGMLLFSLCIQALIRKIGQYCTLAK